LRYLKGMTGLAWLNLNGDKITDQGLVHLHPLSQLVTMDLFSTTITKEGLRKLKQALPRTQVLGPPELQ
jgi:hypothetical protein